MQNYYAATTRTYMRNFVSDFLQAKTLPHPQHEGPVLPATMLNAPKVADAPSLISTTHTKQAEQTYMSFILDMHTTKVTYDSIEHTKIQLLLVDANSTNLFFRKKKHTRYPVQ